VRKIIPTQGNSTTSARIVARAAVPVSPDALRDSGLFDLHFLKNAGGRRLRQ